MKEINYNVLKDEFINIIKDIDKAVISTSYKDYVTSRTVYCFYQDEDIYFITSKAYTKVKQIIKNPNVAVCKDNLQIEGKAEVLGHPNEFHIKVNDEKTNNYINWYARLKNAVLIRIKSQKVTLYKGKGFYQYLYIEDKKAFSKGRENV